MSIPWNHGREMEESVRFLKTIEAYHAQKEGKESIEYQHAHELTESAFRELLAYDGMITELITEAPLRAEDKQMMYLRYIVREPWAVIAKAMGYEEKYLINRAKEARKAVEKQWEKCKTQQKGAADQA